MSVRSTAIVLFFALCLSAPSHAHADVYKWVDDNGVVNYGDTPPQRAKGVKPLDLKSGVDGVIPGIPREELERLREQDTQRRLRQLEAEVEALRAREAEQAAAPAPAPTEPRFTGYPGYWHGAVRPQRPGTGLPHRPTHPIAKPWPRDAEPLPIGRPSVPGGVKTPPNRRPPGANPSPELPWKR